MKSVCPSIVTLIAIFFLSQPATAGSAWDTAYDNDGRRFIPVQLWTGSEWDGKRELTFPPADLHFGTDNNKRIIGPQKWTHEATGTVHDVYERRNRGKVQYFALTPRKDGLGRVFDNRYPRYCPDEVKFPVGWWKQGEKRIYDIDCHGGRKRHIEVTITKLNFRYDGIPHSLEFHWKLDAGTKRGSNNFYTYSPKQGLVKVDSN
jgi:hypothetical protein